MDLATIHSIEAQPKLIFTSPKAPGKRTHSHPKCFQSQGVKSNFSPFFPDLGLLQGSGPPRICLIRMLGPPFSTYNKGNWRFRVRRLHGWNRNKVWSQGRKRNYFLYGEIKDEHGSLILVQVHGTVLPFGFSHSPQYIRLSDRGSDLPGAPPRRRSSRPRGGTPPPARASAVTARRPPQRAETSTDAARAGPFKRETKRKPLARQGSFKGIPWDPPCKTKKKTEPRHTVDGSVSGFEGVAVGFSGFSRLLWWFRGVRHFVGMYKGIQSCWGFLKWCEMDSAHPQYGSRSETRWPLRLSARGVRIGRNAPQQHAAGTDAEFQMGRPSSGNRQKLNKNLVGFHEEQVKPGRFVSGRN